MIHSFACGSSEHALSRRKMLSRLLGGTAGVLATAPCLFAEEVRRQRKQVLFLWLDGGMSQFESWDPKSGTTFGGPFQAIQTSVAGVKISELMPMMAQRLDRFSIVRSMHTRFEDHSRAVVPIQQGDPKNRGVNYPFLGSAFAKLQTQDDEGLPPYIHIKPGSGGFVVQEAGFLGAKYGCVVLGDGKAPPNLLAPVEDQPARVELRQQFRDRLNERFTRGRQKDVPEAYSHTFRTARQMARHAHLFDPSRLKPEDVARYGGSELARHMVQARQLLESGVSFVKVTMYHWDTHGDNFNCHQEGVPQVDAALAGIIDDLIDRGLYEQTLVVVMAEFGRTPKINARVGRDHWPECWSMGLGGGGIKPGVVVGRTNDRGTFNTDRELDVGHLFHTFFQTLGIDPVKTSYDNGGQPLPIAHDDYSAIQELLA